MADTSGPPAPGANTSSRKRHPGGDVLSQRALNRATLARQMLLDRKNVAPLDAITHLVAMQAQNPLDPYLALWSRLAGFRPEELAGLVTGRQVVRAPLLRTTLHLVSAGDCLALRPVVQHILERVFRSTAFHRDIQGVDLAELLAVGRDALTAQPLTGPGLRAVLAARWPDHDAGSLAYAVRYIVPLVQVPPRGVWGQGGQVTWATVESWLGQPVGNDRSPEWLVPRYLASFGPASVKDMQNWSGLTRLGEVFDRLRPTLRTFRNEAGVELFDLPDAPRPGPDLPAPVRFLPEYDNVLLGHDDRGRFIPPARLARYVRHNPFLVDGLFRGVWRLQRAKPATNLDIDPFEPLRPDEEQAVVAEARRLLTFLAPGTVGEVRFTVLL